MISDLLKNKTRKQQAIVKAGELAKERLTSFTIRGITIEIVSQPVFERNCVRLILQATKNGKRLNLDNPFYFYNPPIMVPTGQKRQIFDHATQRNIEIDTYEENPQLALKENIIQTIEQLIERGLI